MLIDTHAHLNFKDFENSYPQIIERAFEVGVKKIIVAGSDLKTSKKAVEIAEKFEGVFAAIGLHPTHLLNETFDEDNFLKLMKNPTVVALGETGLDYYRNKESFGQVEIFEKFLKLANLLNKPVIIHSRDSADDLMSILMGQKNLPKCVIHCFSEDWQFAQAVLDMGLYISFTGIITFTKNEKTFEVIRETPLDRIMIETDSPYLAPEPYRGKVNEPAYVVEVAKKIAEIKKIPLDKVADQTTQNAKRFFGI